MVDYRQLVHRRSRSEMCMKFSIQPKGKMPIRRPVHRWCGNLEMCFKPKDVDRFHVA